MKTTIPEELKKDLPQTSWGKFLVATPVIMTVLATLLAGLASSEMTKAQYDRAYAAQIQAKAGDQWGYFQAKKARGAMQLNTLELLQATVDVHPLSAAALGGLSPVATAALEKNQLPTIARSQMDEQVRAALKALEESKPETEIAELLKLVNPKTLDAALRAAKDDTIAFDTAVKPIGQSLEQLEKSLATNRPAARDFAASKMRLTATRYDAEARLNQTVANLLELQVRQNNISAERHHRRSARFFLGMLGAQAAVIVSTLAMAARQRNLLWTLAATAGIAAVVFAIYVYLMV
jgi:hypothetical protein